MEIKITDNDYFYPSAGIASNRLSEIINNLFTVKEISTTKGGMVELIGEDDILMEEEVLVCSEFTIKEIDEQL